MGIFHKSKKSPNSSATNSPKAPRRNTKDENGTQSRAASSNRASGFFSLDFHELPVEEESIPAPAPLHHNPQSDPSYLAQSAIRHQTVTVPASSMAPPVTSPAAAFYDNIPQRTVVQAPRRSASYRSSDIPPVLLKPPKLSHTKHPSDELSNVDFGSFDGVYVNDDAVSTIGSLASASLGIAPVPEHENTTLSQHDVDAEPARRNFQNSSPSSLYSNTSFSPSVNTRQDMTNSLDSEPKPQQGSDLATDDSLGISNLPAPFNSYSNSIPPSESNVSESVGLGFVNQDQDVGPPPRTPTQNMPMSIPAASEVLQRSPQFRSPGSSPSAAAAALAIANTSNNKSQQLKIGTVKVIESQKTKVEPSEKPEFLSGVESYSAYIEHSTGSSQITSDNESEDGAQGKGVQNSNNATTSTVRSASDDSSYVNIRPQTSGSISSGVVVHHESSGSPNSASNNAPEAKYKYGFSFDNDSGDEDHGVRVIPVSSIPTSGSVPATDQLKLQDTQPYEDDIIDDYTRRESQVSVESSFASYYEDDGQSNIYQPQPQRAGANVLMDSNQVRASVTSTASSNILDTNGGFGPIPNSESASPERQELSTKDVEEQVEENDNDMEFNNRPLSNFAPIPMLPRRNSYARTLSTYMPNNVSNYRSSHMEAPPVSETGVHYPAPIPTVLKLPPLLSKKNLQKAKMGRPISRRPGSMLHVGNMEFPAPPVWHVENADRRSMMSRRHSNASTLNGLATSRKSVDLESTLDLENEVKSQNSKESNQSKNSENKLKKKTKKKKKKSKKLFSKDKENLEGIETGEGIGAYEPKEGGINGVEAKIGEEGESDNGSGTDEEYESGSEEEESENDAEQESGNEEYTTHLSEGRIAELKDESWHQRPSWAEQRYSQSNMSYVEDDDYDDDVRSDCATLPSDDEYQEDILLDENGIEVKEPDDDKYLETASMTGKSMNDFAFTSFNPNAPITERGLLGGSISYSSHLVPAVGIQPPSLIEELEMRKAGRQARLRKVYYDTNTGNAIATEVYKGENPNQDQLIRLPHSGHPLDYRHAKSLLELEAIADQNYEERKHYAATIHNVAEQDRISRMGLSTNNLPNYASTIANGVSGGGGENESDGDQNESLGARRARLKKKKMEEKMEAVETLAERRARLKKEKMKMKDTSSVVGIEPAQQPVSMGVA